MNLKKTVITIILIAGVFMLVDLIRDRETDWITTGVSSVLIGILVNLRGVFLKKKS